MKQRKSLETGLKIYNSGLCVADGGETGKGMEGAALGGVRGGLEHDGRPEFSRLGHKLLPKFSSYIPDNGGERDLEAVRRLLATSNFSLTTRTET